MTRLRASSIALVTRGADPDAEALLVLRAPELAFFGGWWALPGGNLEPVDRAGAPDEEAAALRCAARELFEETGVLPAPLAARLGRAEREPLRSALAEHRPSPAREAALGRWRALVDAAPEGLAALRRLGVLVTPPFVAVRHRTRLFHLALPEGERVDVRPGELVEGRLWRASEALASWRRDETPIVPPALHLLEALARMPVAEALADAERTCAALEAGALRAVRVAAGLALVPLRTPTLPPATTTNAVLVGDERVWVVDPATPYPDERERFLALLERVVAEGRELAGVVVTHHHADHTGAVAATARRFGLPVRAHPRTLARLPEPVERAAPLVEGDRLELGADPEGRPGWGLVARETPGHDRGHLVLVDDRRGACVCGDLVSTLSTIVIDPPEGHLATYLASLERVRALRPSLLVPAHGPVSRDPDALLAGYLAHRAAREHKLVGALAAGPRREAELLAAVYDDVDPGLHPVAARSLAAGLEKLAEEGRAEARDGRWRLVGEAAGGG